MLTILAFMAAALGVLMGLSPLLQALRAHSMKSSKEISLPFLAILAFGSATWLAYGIALSNPSLIVANTVGTISWTIVLGVALYWRRGKRG